MGIHLWESILSEPDIDDVLKIDERQGIGIQVWLADNRKFVLKLTITLGDDGAAWDSCFNTLLSLKPSHER